jgi:hypothetical protein
MQHSRLDHNERSATRMIPGRGQFPSQDKKRSLLATGHSLLVIFYHLLRSEVEDQDLVGSQPLHATIRLSALPFESHTLTFILTSATANQSSEVKIANVNDFERNTL